MKQEAQEVSDVGRVEDSEMGMEDFQGISTREEAVEIDIKYELPLIVNQPEGRRKNFQFNLKPPLPLYFNEGEEGYEDHAEMGEIERIINKGQVNVKEMEPVTIPIPIIEPASEANPNDIIINYTKRKPEGSRPKPKTCICTICHTGFPSQVLFQIHMSSVHADTRPYSCSHCGKRFSSTGQVKIHETIHDPNRFKGDPQFACDFCDNKYHLKRSLEGHRKSAHLGYKKPNRPSNKIVTEHHSSGVRNHRLSNVELKVFKCPHCDLKFAQRCLVKKHMRVHSNEMPYECDECGQRFASSGSQQHHMKSRHLNPSNNPRPLRPQFMYKQPCPCNICGRVFKVPSQLQKHMTYHTGEKPYECPVCLKRFRLKGNLIQHHKRLHIIQRGPVNENEAFKCLICGKDGFALFVDLRNHRMRSHRHIPCDPEKEKPYGCGICGKPYYQKGQAMVCALLKHDPTSLHAAMFKYKCPECPEERFGYRNAILLRSHWEAAHADKPLPVRFRANSGMYKNLETREETLPYVTVNKALAKSIKENGPAVKPQFPLYTEFDLLPVEFKFYREIKKHMVGMQNRLKKATESPKEPYTCSICNKQIVHLRNFRRHMKTHENDKPLLSCTICRKHFQKGSTLDQHKRKHHPDPGKFKPLLSCTICGKHFQKRSTLDQHKRKQHPELKSKKWHFCAICSKRFRKPKSLRLHEKVQHQKKVVAVNRKSNVGRPRKIPLPQVNFISTCEESSASDCLTINVKDTAAVERILGNREARLILQRIDYLPGSG